MNQKDIANLLGVSTSTVSRVLNKGDTRSISKELKSKIINIAIENGIKIKSYTYGVIVGSVNEKSDDPYFSDILIELDESFEEFSYYRKYVFTIKQVQEMHQIEFKENCGSVDGIILISLPPEKILKSIITEITKNIVCIDEIFSLDLNSKDLKFLLQYTFDKITFNSGDVICETVEYLSSLGSKKIAIVEGINDRKNSPRNIGYIAGLKKICMDYNDSLVYKSNYNFDGGSELAQQIYNSMELDAIICCNDKVAVGFVNTLINLGISVPEKIRVVGFNDVMLAQYNEPPLTTIKVDFKELANVCATILNLRVKGKLTSQTKVVLSLNLVKRKTT